MPSIADLQAHVLGAWSSTAQYVAGHEVEFVGRYKEREVVRHLRGVIEARAPSMQVHGPDSQVLFKAWRIDLVCTDATRWLAVEAKFKTQRDGAVPDNRKAAFFDLFKLEQYLSSGEYAAGLFLWLSDHEGYRSIATGDSSDFSTHSGRVYNSGTRLRASRSRDASMPNPLVLGRSYQFSWSRVPQSATWYSLAIPVRNGAG